MLLSEVKRLASKGEGVSIEFKKKAAHPEKIIKEVIALANTYGGFLLIGVDDDGTVSGQKYIQDEVFVMEREIKESIFPELNYEVHAVPVTEKKGVAVFDIPVSENRPHYLKEADKRKSFVRVEDRSVQASKEVWEIIKKRKNQRDVVFTYGEKEEILLKALEEKGSLTVREYSRLAKIPRFLASRTLIRLTLANVLEIHPEESEDFFTLKEEV